MRAEFAARALAASEALAAARLRRPWVVLAVLALCAGLSASLWFARSAGRARADAAHAPRMLEFTEGLFTSGPDGVPQKDLTVSSLLEQGVKQARALDTDRPAQAEMLHTLGKVYEDLGQFSTADELFGDALRARQRLFGTGSAEAADTLNELSALRDDQGRYPEGLALAEQANAIDARVLQPDAAQRLWAQTRLAICRIDLGQYAQAVPLLESVIAHERGKPELDAQLSDALTDLANADIYLGKTEDSLRLNLQSLALDRKRVGDKHPDVGASLINLS